MTAYMIHRLMQIAILEQVCLLSKIEHRTDRESLLEMFRCTAKLLVALQTSQCVYCSCMHRMNIYILLWLWGEDWWASVAIWKYETTNMYHSPSTSCYVQSSCQ
jgi:hypothetical protein